MARESWLVARQGKERVLWCVVVAPVARAWWPVAARSRRLAVVGDSLPPPFAFHGLGHRRWYRGGVTNGGGTNRKGQIVKTLAEQHTQSFMALRDSIQRDGGVNFYDLDYPGLYELRDGEWVEYPHNYGDIYILIRAYANTARRDNTSSSVQALALVTSGWASRLPEGHDVFDDSIELTAPSKSPDRMRCSMVYGLARDGSVFSFLDIQDTETTTDSYGRGQLLDACEFLGLSVWKREWALGLLSWYSAVQAEAHAAGDDLEPQVVRWFAERLATIQEMLGHALATDDDDETDE